MPTEPDRPLVTREIAERDDAHRRYNEALTALDKAIQSLPEWPAPPSAYDETMLPAINEAWKILPEGGPATSTWGADKAWRLVAPLFERQMAFNAALVDHLNRNAAAHREIHDAVARALPATRESLAALAGFESLLVQFLQRITPLADARDRETRQAIDELRNVAEVAQRAAVMAKREIERLATGTPKEGPAVEAPPSLGAPFKVKASSEAYKYLGFEDRFRGSEDDIRARLADYAPYFDGASNVLDVGCGRGEFLALLKERGVASKGLDLNPEMVEACLARGLDVSTGDALTVLHGLPDESLGGLIAVQVIEHLEPAYLSDFLQTAYYKLRPGSRIVLETINPACWVAFFESYIRDLTHVRPIHPETLQYMLHASGFSAVDLVYRSPIAEEARLQRVTPRPEHFGDASADPVTELVSAFNRNMDRLNSRLFTFQDYAAVARRS
ncbi:MAG: class I SAM-dependent methyltransferase [Acidobacteriota bacterium]|nr:class I SAM-dependent methyltransferase [Acidobacteriota bacterium]